MRTPVIRLSIGLVAVITISVMVRDPLLVGLLSLISLVAICGSSVFATCQRRGVARKRQLAVLLTGASILAIVGVTNTPLRLTFLFFEAEFELLGRQLVRGDHPDFPRWVGPFRVSDGGVRRGSAVPYLMTSGHPFEVNGFVRDPEGKYFNTWSITQLGENWAYIEED